MIFLDFKIFVLGLVFIFFFGLGIILLMFLGLRVLIGCFFDVLLDDEMIEFYNG